jgi:putative acetyltransferase
MSRVAPEDLRLRRAEPADHVAVARIMSAPQTYAGTLQQPFASIEHWRERLAKHDPQHFQIVAEVREEADGAFEVVGHLGLVVQPQQRRSHVSPSATSGRVAASARR